MSVTTLYYNPAYTNGNTYTFDWSGVTFNSSDSGATYVGSPIEFNTGQVPSHANLTNVTIGTAVTIIGNNTFQSCSKLTSVTIPNSVVTVNSYVFLLCSNLVTVTIGNSVSTIGVSVFSYCTKLTSITVDVNNNSYSSLNGVLYDKLQQIIIRYPPALGNSFTIPSSVKNIGDYAFIDCYDLTSVTIPNSVTNIGLSSFEVCINLSSVTIPIFVTNISDYAFNGCNNLSSVIIGSSVSSIGNNAFFSCTILSTVTISDATANNLNATWHSPTANPPGISNFYGATNPVEFLEPSPPPTITSVSPNSGNKDGGTLVTITGTNFTGTTGVTFGGVPATSVIVSSDTELTCVAPAGPAGPVNVQVITSGGFYTDINAFTNNIICFKEGSKILTDKGYKLIETLRNGDLVQTVSSGFKKIEHIGFSKMYNNVNKIRSKDKLYRYSQSEYPEIFEDLIITGCHSILIDEYKDEKERERTIEINGNTYITDNKYRLPACVDERAKIFEEEGVHTIWHFSLEHSDYYMNYGVYANGLLVETTSNRMMVEQSGMTLV